MDGLDMAVYAQMREDNLRAAEIYGPVWTLAAHQIDIADRFVDAFVNIYSLPKCPKAIDNYFSQLGRVTAGVFYSKQRRIEKNMADGIDVTASTYTIQPSWKLLFERDTVLYEAFYEAAYAIHAR